MTARPAWMRCACAVVLLVWLCDAHTPPGLTTVYEWRQHEFVFPSPAHRQALIQQGLYIPNASVPLDVDVHNGRVFITTPRFRPGVPATLSTVVAGHNNQSPLLQPYPDWSWHKPGHCDGMTSVFRVTIDECGRLWAIDTGSVDIFVSRRDVCPKQLFVFDLSNDKLITRHRFPANIIKPDTVLTAIQVEVVNPRHDSKCRTTFAYITDTTTYGLIVYDMKNDRSWRVTDNSFWPIPKFGHYQLQGSEFDLMDGILGVALSPPDNNKPRHLYYHSLASNTENHVPTNVLKNEANFANSGNTARQEFKTFPQTRIGQSAAEDISSNGILFYSELMEPSLRCYNTRKPFRGAKNPTVVRDLERLQFAAGMKVRKNQQGVEEIWILTDRLQKLIVGTLTPTEINFRVLRGNVNQLVANTECVGSRHPVGFGTRGGEEGEEEVTGDLLGETVAEAVAETGERLAQVTNTRLQHTPSVPIRDNSKITFRE